MKKKVYFVENTARRRECVVQLSGRGGTARASTRGGDTREKGDETERDRTMSDA